MLEKLGRKFMRGAKAEMFQPPGENGKDYILDLILGIGKIGLLGLAMLLDGGSGSKKGQQSTVIVNNYIYKGEKE